MTVHGLWMRAGAMLVLQRRLEGSGLGVHRFGYPSVRQSLDANAAMLAEFVERVPGDTVHLVAHSLGGVVIRAMLEHGVPLFELHVHIRQHEASGTQMWIEITRFLERSLGFL